MPSIIQGKDEFLGEARGRPVVQLGIEQNVELQWLELRRQGEHVGDLLAAFELVLDEGVTKAMFDKSITGEHKQIVVPAHIAPKTELHRIEVT